MLSEPVFRDGPGAATGAVTGGAIGNPLNKPVKGFAAGAGAATGAAGPRLTVPVLAELTLLFVAVGQRNINKLVLIVSKNAIYTCTNTTTTQV